MISYRKNCEEIIRLHQKSGSPGQLLALFDLTKGVEMKSESVLFNDEELEDGKFTVEQVIV